jgi:hypothetical protein
MRHQHAEGFVRAQYLEGMMVDADADALVRRLQAAAK